MKVDRLDGRSSVPKTTDGDLQGELMPIKFLGYPKFILVKLLALLQYLGCAWVLAMNLIIKTYVML
jgi:hypothetical protein